MKPNIQPIDRKFQRRQRAIALITVLSVLAIMTIMAVAMLTLSMNETKSANKYADGEKASSLADSAVSLVMGQIWDATNQQAGGARAIWASQPGAIRRYNMNGGFQAGYKLYSTDTMVVNGAEAQMVADVPDNDWAALSGRWVDLNEPVIRPSAAGAVGNEVIFPIIDPRAFVPTATDANGLPTPGGMNVEGFWYDQGFAGVAAATGPLDNNARLPMPVQWLYLLKDGTIGWVNGGEGGTYQFQTAAAGGQPSEENPIVGRIAFWTDDESCKVNINTAGEPTPWSLPVTYHQRDHQYAMFPPTRFEFQRYPGHPATVALSSVLFPNTDFDTYGRTPAAIAQIVALKERIYDVMPKINNGGSKSATIPFWTQEDPSYAGALRVQRVDIGASLNERLYASVDEMIFSQTVNGGVRQSQNSQPGVLPLFGMDGRAYVSSGVTTQVIPENRSMDRLRFFLTAHSRAPEVNMHGGPRVAIWPVADEVLGPGFRTGFDNVIAFCSSLGGPANSYIFRRQNSDSMTVDATLARNVQLLNYLYTLMGQPYPSGGAASGTFVAKYGAQNAAQILVQIFDYIRSTNLYDGALAPTKQELLNETGPYSFTIQNNNSNIAHLQRFQKRDQAEPLRNTYTRDRASVRRVMNDLNGQVRSNEVLTSAAMPGHGQVVPSRTVVGGQLVQGFGRFVTLSEIGLHFICTADGTPDNGSWRIQGPDGSRPPDPPAPPHPVIGGGEPNRGSLYDPYSPDCVYSGGRTSTRATNVRIPSSGATFPTQTWADAGGRGLAFVDQSQPARWFSNFPPLSGRRQQPIHGVSPQATGNGPRTPGNHPGFDPLNWNHTLQTDTPLRPGQRRVQGQIGLELTVPASGYVGIFPEFCLKISGLSRFQLADAVDVDKRMFKNGDSLVYRSNSNQFGGTHARVVGGSISPTNVAEGRMARGMGRMPEDSGRAALTGGPTEDPQRGKSYFFSNCFDLLTDFFTVEGGTMRIVGGDLTVELYAGMDPSDNEKKVQTFTIPWPNQVTVPTPQLVVVGVPGESYQETTGGVRNINRVEAPHWWAFHRGGALGRSTGTNPGAVPPRLANRTNGRLANFGGHNSGSRRGLPRDYELIWGRRTAGELAQYTDTNTQQRVVALPGQRGYSAYISPGIQAPYGQDTLLSMVIRHGDIRMTACLPEVGPEHWGEHPLFRTGTNYMAHTFVRHDSDDEAGFNTGEGTSFTKRMVPFAPYHAAIRPDLAATDESRAAQAYGDFDNGVGPLRDGAWINKADEGNSGVADDDQGFGSNGSETRRIITAYFDDIWMTSESSETFMSPNRMISSPIVFGSLPAAVYAGGATGATPWRTLLFRPFTAPPLQNGSLGHPGSPNYAGGPEFSGVNPADHYLLDLFWMPVVEPYAISEPLSTAGKINLNYQMLPFHNYITRSTGLHAALKGEILTAVPTADARVYKRNPDGDQRSMYQVQAEFGNYWERAKWSESDAYASERYSTDFNRTGNNPGPQRAKFWHRKIETERRVNGFVQGTLAQFESRFNFLPNAPAAAHGLFRTASQICEVHLMPQTIAGTQPASEVGSITPPPTDGSDPVSGGGRGGEGGGGGSAKPYQLAQIQGFWQARAVTGDNTKERTYANVYQKVTTQSNTFRVHYRVQSIRKARSVNPTSFDPAADTVASDQRGSVLIERRIDPTNPGIPDYANAPGAVGTNPLDNFYRFRVLEQKRFNP